MISNYLLEYINDEIKRLKTQIKKYNIYDKSNDFDFGVCEGKIKALEDIRDEIEKYIV